MPALSFPSTRRLEGIPVHMVPAYDVEDSKKMREECTMYIIGTAKTFVFSRACSSVCSQENALPPKVIKIIRMSHPQSTHRVATAAFWGTFLHDGKLAQAGGGGGWGGALHAHPLSIYYSSRTKLQCTLQLRGQLHSPYFISTPICTLWSPLILKYS